MFNFVSKTKRDIRFYFNVVKDKEENFEDQIKPNEIVKELYNIRMSIDSFLEKFERSLKLSDMKIHAKLEGNYL